MREKLTMTTKGSLSILALAVTCGLPSLATAQTDKEEQGGQGASSEIEEVVVQGFRKSLNDSLNAKRDSTELKDEIHSEDIGKFPDLNLAEAIQRVAGVAIRRDNGEGVEVELRGLGSQYTNTMLNGLPVATAWNDNRGAALDNFASELFSRVSIEKTASAKQVEGGISGVVNMRNARPFDFDEGLSITTSAQGGYNTQAEEFDPRGTFMVSNTFDTNNGRIGVLVGASYSERSVRIDGWETQDWGSRAANTIRGFEFADGNRSGMQSSTWDTIANDPDDLIPDDTTSGELEQVIFPRLQRTDLIYGDRERLGTVLSLQWEANADMIASFDWLHSELDDLLYRENIDAEVRNATTLDPVNIVADSAGYLITGTLENVNRRSESRRFFDFQEFDQYVGELNWQATENLNLNFKAAYNESKYEQRHLTFLSSANGTTATFDYSANSDIPSVISSVDLTDPANFELSSIRAEPQDRGTTNTSFHFDGEWGDDSSRLDFGMAWDEFTYYNIRYRRNASADSFTDQWVNGNTPTSEQVNHVLPINDYASDFNNPDGAVLSWVVTDWAAADALTQNGLDAMLMSGWPEDAYIPELKESNLAFYTQYNGRSQLAGRELRFNTGIRAIKTDQATRNISNTGAPVAIDREYWDYLPSFNLAWDAREDVVARLSAARAMTRPDLGQLEGTTSITSDFLVSNDNPRLSPFYSDQIDVGVEWYFAPESVLSLNLFHKQLSGFVERDLVEGPFRDSGIAISSLDPDIYRGLTPDTTVTYSTFVNSDETREMTGYEFAFQMPFDELLPINGFGTMVNYTHIKSSDITYNTALGELVDSIVGLSPDVVNVLAYYDQNDWALRASYNYRSAFTEAGCCRNNQPLLRTRESREQVDLTALYRVNDNISISLEGLNVTGEKQYTAFGDRLNRWISSGTQYMLSVRASF